MKSTIRRLLKKQPDPKVVQELGKLLVGHPDLKVSLKELSTSAARLKVELRRKFGTELENFYRNFLRKCLKHKVLSSDDWKALQTLKGLFGFSDSFIENVHNEEIVRYYRKGIDEALTDKKLMPDERSMLKFIHEKWHLSPELAQQIYRDKASQLIESALINAISDQRLSPKQEKELQALADRLGVRIEMDEKTLHILDRYRLYWLIENGEIPVIEAAIPLSAKERCFFMAKAAWCHPHTGSRFVRYGKGSGSIEEESLRRTTQEMIEVDSGLLYLTNKRLIFYGNSPRTITLKQIVDFVPVKDGIHILKRSGTSPFLKFELAVDVFSLMLARCLRDLRN